jgi:type I restriction enzyme, S subunit
MTEGLKPGWRRWRFEQMATNVNERVDDPSEAGVDFYVGLEHLDSDSLKIRRWGSPEDVSATKLLFEPGDIIFGRRRAYQRKLGVAEWRGIASAHSLVLRAKPEVVLPEFLPFFMQSDLFMDRAQRISVGSLSPTINWKTLAKEEFALPPLEEQRRMAVRLSRTWKVLEKLYEAKTALSSMFDSLLLQLYTKGVSGFSHARGSTITPRGWQLLPLRDRYDIQLGKMMSRKAREGNNQVPYLRNANVQWNELDLSDVQTMSFSRAEQSKFELRYGDILACEGRHVGKSSIWREEIPGACYQKALHRLRRRSDKDEPEFLLHCLRFYSVAGRFAAETAETTIPHLSAERFGSMMFPFAPLDEQREVIGIIGDVDSGQKDLEKRRDATQSMLTAATAEWI